MDETGLAIFGEEQAEQTIRRAWHDGRWFFSVIDIVGLLTDAPKPRQYWFDMKRRVQDEGFREVSAACRQLKLPSPDGKQRLTDAADAETILRLVQSIPSPKAEPFKRWLARVGTERLREVEDPALAADRLRSEYERMGYSAEWIRARLENVVVRDDLTIEWRERGAAEGREFALLTDTLSRGTFDLTTAEHKAVKGLKPRHNLRDSMTTLELVLTSLAEATATAIHQAHDSQGFGKLRRDAHEAGNISGAARRDIEAATGEPVVSPTNYPQLRTERQRELRLPLFGAPADGS